MVGRDARERAGAATAEVMVRRRRLLGALAAGAGVLRAQALDAGALGNVAAAHGMTLAEGRLRVLHPVLARREAALRALRDFPVDDSVEPAQGI